MWYIGELSNTIVALILSSILFGMAHVYQGNKGIIQASSTGFIMALLYISTGTLWMPIALHIIIDIYSGLIAWLGLEKTEEIVTF